MKAFENKEKRIAVIGAGIIGVNCALALQNEGFNVTLIDKNAIGEGCSKNNAGHFATEQVFPLADPSLLWQLPKMLLDPFGPISLAPKHLFNALPWFGRFFNNMRTKYRDNNILALKALNKNAIHYYLPLLKEAKANNLISIKGSLLVFEQTPLKRIQKIQLYYQQAGIAVKLLSKEQVHELEPNLHSNINYGLFFTEVAHTINPYQLTIALADLAKSKGAEYKQFEINSIKHKPNKITLSDGNTQLSFDKVVIATGAWSKSLCLQLGYYLPIEAERGYSLSVTDATLVVKNSLTRPVASAERKFIITPMANELRFAGTVEYAGLLAKPNYERAAMLYKNAQFILKNLPNNQKFNDANKWMGCRPSLPDSLPVICQAPKQANVFFALGHQHLGLTQGAITGKLISQLVLMQKTEIDTKPFCISRFN